MNLSPVTIAKSPAPTWRWLGLNSLTLSLPEEGIPTRTEQLLAEAGEKKVFVQLIEDHDLYARLDTDIKAEEGSSITLVQVYAEPEEGTHISTLSATVEKNAHLHLIQLILGGKKQLIDCRTQLIGDESRLQVDLGYLAQKDTSLDLNYNVPQLGKRTQSEIRVHGVLKDRASKIFRGTIDFQRGSGGSKGSEQEDVLLLTEGVRNQTLPVILCAEEDVEGSHGASIGQLDEATLFYLQSRGLDTPNIIRILSRSRLQAVANLIPDEDTKAHVTELLENLHFEGDLDES